MTFHATARRARRAIQIAQSNTQRASGWKRVGNGGSRVAMLHIASKVVYKVDYYDDDNRREHKQATELREWAWQHVYIPMTELFDVDGRPVIAMEFIEGTLGENIPRKSHTEARRELFDVGQFHDMHGQNFIAMEDGRLAPIDMGHGRGPSVGWRQPDTRVLNCGDGSLWG